MYKIFGKTHAIKFTREAARVERTHTCPGHGSHSVGNHTFNMLTMLFILKENPSIDLIKAVIQHDIPERVTGDMPHPAKMMGVLNRDKQSEIEESINRQIFYYHAEHNLSIEEAKWLHGLDMLEFYCYVKDQISLGNIGIKTKLLAVEEYMIQYAHKYPVEILDAYEDIRAHEWLQCSDVGGW